MMHNISDLFSLDGKVAVITGASRGLGLGMAKAIAGAGGKVVLASRDAKALAAAADEIKCDSCQAFPIPTDITSEKDIDYLIQQVIEQLGHVDILINNAGINVRKPFLEITATEFGNVMNSNLTAGFLFTQKIAKLMIAAHGGKIINIASLTSQLGVKNVAAYAASKGAVASLTKTLAVELAPYNINVNAIAPGYFRTSMTEDAFADDDRKKWILSRIPLKRAGTPEDLYGTVIFLASTASDYLTGQIVFVDGGWTAS